MGTQPSGTGRLVRAHHAQVWFLSGMSTYMASHIIGPIAVVVTRVANEFAVIRVRTLHSSTSFAMIQKFYSVNRAKVSAVNAILI